MGAFRSGRTSLAVPSSVEAGVPFDLSLSFSNESDARVIGAYVVLRVPASASLLLETLAVGGRPLRGRLVSATEAHVPLLPLAPHEEGTLTCRATLLPDVDGARNFTIGAEVWDRGEMLPLSASIRVEATAYFTKEASVVDLAGHDTIFEGEYRDVTIVAYNEGTAAANKVRLDLGLVGLLHDDAKLSLELGDILPGSSESVTFRVRSNGEAPAIRPLLYSDNKLLLQFEEPPIRLITPARFTAEKSRLIAKSQELVKPLGGTAVVVLSLFNEGDLPAKKTTVRFTCDEGTIVSHPASQIVLENILEGERREEEIIIRADSRHNVIVGAQIVDGPELQSIEIEVAASESFAIHSFTVEPGPLLVGVPFTCSLTIMNDGNRIANGCGVAIDSTAGLAYHLDSLEINGLPIDDTDFRGQNADGTFRGQNRMAFMNVEPGALIEIKWKLVALRPTLAGRKASVNARVTWDGEQAVEETLSGLHIEPKAIYADNLEALPFTILDVDRPARLAVERQLALPPAPTFAPRPAVKTPAASSDETLSFERDEPELVASEDRVGPEAPHSASDEWLVNSAKTPASSNGHAVFDDQQPTQTLEEILDAFEPSSKFVFDEPFSIPIPNEERAIDFPAPQTPIAYEVPFEEPVVKEPVRLAAAPFTPEQRIKAETILGGTSAREALPLFTHIAAIRAFMPAAIVSADELLVNAYSQASTAMMTLMMQPLLKYKATGNIFVQSSSVELFAQRAEPFASRVSQLENTPLKAFSSAWNIPSVAASLAAIASYGFLAFPADTPERAAVESYLTKLVAGLATMDSIDLTRFADAFGEASWIANLDDEYAAMRHAIALPAHIES